ncbi:hypothetical protein Tco_0377219 [Tanacetum coccineum]
MSRSADQAQTPANYVVRNTAGKGSKQAVEGDSKYLPEEKLQEICHRDGNFFTRLGERRKNVHSRLGPEVVPRRRHASERRNASSNRSAKNPNRRKKDARSLIRSYVICSSERQREIEEEWYAADCANRRQLARTKEAYLSKDENDQGGHWKSWPKKHRLNGEDDLS